MAKVHIRDPAAAAAAAHGGDGLAAHSPNLTPIHGGAGHHHMASATSIVHTAEAMQMATEDFAEHIDHCNVAFRQAIMEKVKELKKTDTTILTERVSTTNF